MRFLENFRLVSYFWNGRFSEHVFGSKYVKVFEETDYMATLGFEDLDEDAGYIPDYDYQNPLISVYDMSGRLLVYIRKYTMGRGIATSWLYYMSTKIYTFTRPVELSDCCYILIDPNTGVILSFGDYLKDLIASIELTASWGEHRVRAGTTITLYATAESSGLILTIRITKPDGTKIEGTMTDLGDGNYSYTTTFDIRGEWLIEVIYPDGMKRKMVVLVN